MIFLYDGSIEKFKKVEIEKEFFLKKHSSSYFII